MYEVVEGVHGNLIIYKNGKEFIPTNFEPLDETDMVWDRMAEIKDALEDICTQGRLHGLEEAFSNCTTLGASLQEQGMAEFERNGYQSNQKTRSFAHKVEGVQHAAIAIRALIRNLKENTK